MKSCSNKPIIELCRELQEHIQIGEYQCIVVTAQMILLVPNKGTERA